MSMTESVDKWTLWKHCLEFSEHSRKLKPLHNFGESNAIDEEWKATSLCLSPLHEQPYSLVGVSSSGKNLQRLVPIEYVSLYDAVGKNFELIISTVVCVGKDSE
jgi:hypothetical protein